MEIVTPLEAPGSWEWFRLKIPNGWLISCGYGSGHYGGNRGQAHVDHRDATTVEIAIFDAENDYYLPEGASVHQYEDGAKSGYLPWQTADQLFSIIEYVSSFAGERL